MMHSQKDAGDVLHASSAVLQKSNTSYHLMVKKVCADKVICMRQVDLILFKNLQEDIYLRLMHSCTPDTNSSTESLFLYAVPQLKLEV